MCRNLLRNMHRKVLWESVEIRRPYHFVGKTTRFYWLFLLKEDGESSGSIENMSMMNIISLLIDLHLSVCILVHICIHLCIYIYIYISSYMIFCVFIYTCINICTNVCQGHEGGGDCFFGALETETEFWQFRKLFMTMNDF